MKRKLLIFFLMLLSGEQKANLLKKLKYFGSIGDKCYLQPFNYGTEPNLIYMGDNVNIASGVKFVNHDVTYMMFNKMCGGGTKSVKGKL